MDSLLGWWSADAAISSPGTWVPRNGSDSAVLGGNITYIPDAFPGGRGALAGNYSAYIRFTGQNNQYLPLNYTLFHLIRYSPDSNLTTRKRMVTACGIQATTPGLVNWWVPRSSEWLICL